MTGLSRFPLPIGVRGLISGPGEIRTLTVYGLNVSPLPVGVQGLIPNHTFDAYFHMPTALLYPEYPIGFVYE